MKVAVIGGGWAGLAAAVELSAAGDEVTVFEAARQLGGRARRVEIHGHLLDNGQHILIGAYRETLRLMQIVGANPEQLFKRLPLELNHPGAGFHLKLPRLPAPLHLAIGLLFAKGCTVGDKYSAARFMRTLQSSGYRFAADCTVAELLDRHQQRSNLRRYLWEPLCLAALNTPPDKASAQIFANVLRDSLGGGRADTDLLLPAADLNRLFPDAAADFIRAHGGAIHLSTRIAQIDPRLEIQGETFDGVILAVAPQHAAVLLDRQVETAAIAEMLANYAYEPIATLYAGYPPDVCLPCPMLGLVGDTGERLGQWVFDRGPLGGAPGVMGFVLSARGAWEECDSETLLATLHGELEETLGRKLTPPRWHQVIRERRATFSCRPDLPRPSTQTPLHGLWLAGDYVCADYPATLEGAVRSGIAAARGTRQGISANRLPQREGGGAG
jgi:squalene-associated FAD-dependent desaturase